MEDDTSGVPINFGLTSIVAALAAGTARLTSLQIEDGYVVLSVRAKLDSIHIAEEGEHSALRSASAASTGPNISSHGDPALEPNAAKGTETVAGYDQLSVPEKASAVASDNTWVAEAAAPQIPLLEDLDDDVMSTPTGANSAHPKPRFELEDLD